MTRGQPPSREAAHLRTCASVRLCALCVLRVRLYECAVPCGLPPPPGRAASAGSSRRGWRTRTRSTPPPPRSGAGRRRRSAPSCRRWCGGSGSPYSSGSWTYWKPGTPAASNDRWSVPPVFWCRTAMTPTSRKGKRICSKTGSTAAFIWSYTPRRRHAAVVHVPGTPRSAAGGRDASGPRRGTRGGPVPRRTTGRCEPCGGAGRFSALRMRTASIITATPTPLSDVPVPARASCRCARPASRTPVALSVPGRSPRVL